MADPRQALEAQLHNLQQRSGRTLAELFTLLRSSGLSRHGELRDHLKHSLGMGHGDANTLVHHYLAQAAPTPTPLAAEGQDSMLDALYAGPKAALRPVHEALMQMAQSLGEFDIAPKKGYLSLRRKKQFAMLRPATKTQVELGLNAKGLAAGARLIEQPPGGMCQYTLRLGSVDEVDAQVRDWLKAAYEHAG